ncbi:hypothetical protein [Thiohalomonas denitrificans]|uniref:Uncharacterized protein n=1 Tax=Thiohalomonas denitrificans TaxID=415747 RepID=A0A1G5QY48_9GAMM|nr:hypothetical protein [Thiohalomonas denitrificans]SCZ66181.1 hypothetical protein SAMN03097708_02921 [Thiohalomonas denitrificans]
MPKQSPRREAQVRQQLAQEAARFMIEGGIRDFAMAKRKAAERLGLSQTRNLPTNREIEQARAEYLSIFQPESQPQRLRELREAAVGAMKMLGTFSPRLVGPVLAGTADDHSPIYLHLFSDTPEQVDFFLGDRGIPFEHDERRVRLEPEKQETFPMYRILADDIVVEMTVFPVKGQRQAPLSPVDGRPMRRANRHEVEALLQEERG